MSAIIETEQELMEEALNILRQNLPPHKLARLLSIWQFGRGGYAQQRDALFAGETVESLFEQTLTQQVIFIPLDVPPHKPKSRDTYGIA